MSNTTILLGRSAKFLRAKKLFLAIVAAFYFFGGVRWFMSNDPIQGTLYVVTGIIFLIINPVFDTFLTRIRRRIEIDDLSIRIKDSIFRESTLIKWKDITQIEFGNYLLKFGLNDSVKEVPINSNFSEVSVAIKKTIRSIAEKKAIPVVGG